MSKPAEQIKQTSQILNEPCWLLAWRTKRAEIAETLPKTLKYGIGISGALPQNIEDSPLHFDKTADYHVDASKGLELYTWKEAIAQEEIAPILEGLMESDLFPKASNYYSGLAQALFRSGLVIYAQPNVGDDGVSKEEKLTLDTMIPKESSADVVIVIAKEGAKLALKSALSGPSSAESSEGEGQDGQSVFARTFIVLTERDAHVRIMQKQSLHKGTTILLSACGIVAAHSSCAWNEVFAGDIAVKSETENILIGEWALGEILQGVVASGSAKYDIFSSVKHLADHTHSHIRAAGLGADTSKIVYRGMIDVAEGIRAVDGGQEARFLVLSPKAEVDAIPALDIASKDVQCTHKLSISHIRDTDTFYPKLRGLSDSESRQLFLEGHFAQVLSTGSRRDFSGEENEEIMDEVRGALSPPQTTY